MENASKALLIAAGMLLSIALMSLMTYAITSMGKSASRIYEQLEESDIMEFNQKYFNYLDKDLNLQDVVSIVNLSKNQNIKPKVSVSVTVFYENSGTEITNEDVNQILTNGYIKNASETGKYICSDIEIDNVSRLVNSITIIPSPTE